MPILPFWSPMFGSHLTHAVVIFLVTTAVDDPPRESIPDAELVSYGLTVSSRSFLCPPFIILRTGAPYRRPLDATGHGVATEPGHRRVPAHVLLPNECARFCRSFACILFDWGGPERHSGIHRHVCLTIGHGMLTDSVVQRRRSHPCLLCH